jgi:Cu/Ag efflux protein CusF
MDRVMRMCLVSIVAACLVATSAFAQKPIERAGNISKTATITAINHTARIVTLKDSQGNVEDVVCGADIKRFDELKVGDSVTFSYHAAVVFQVVKPGASAPSASETASSVAGQGVKPSGAYTVQRKATVTITAIDPAAPSVTVRRADGHTMSAEVREKKSLDGLKVGDKVAITFTEAAMITVEPPKK